MKHEGDILRWAAERNILQCSTPTQQVLKTIEEVDELYGALAVMEAGGKDEATSVAEIADAIGDTIVTLTIISQMCGLTIDDCVRCAWESIKDRKGKLVDGIFVKEAEND